MLIVLADHLHLMRTAPTKEGRAGRAGCLCAAGEIGWGVWSIKAELEDLSFKVCIIIVSLLSCVLSRRSLLTRHATRPCRPAGQMLQAMPLPAPRNISIPAKGSHSGMLLQALHPTEHAEPASQVRGVAAAGDH